MSDPQRPGDPWQPDAYDELAPVEPAVADEDASQPWDIIPEQAAAEAHDAVTDAPAQPAYAAAQPESEERDWTQDPRGDDPVEAATGELTVAAQIPSAWAAPESAPPAANDWSQPAVDTSAANDWSQPAVDTSATDAAPAYEVPASNDWSQPAAAASAATDWSQPAVESPTYAAPAADAAPASEVPASNDWSQPAAAAPAASDFSQPAHQTSAATD